MVYGSSQINRSFFYGTDNRTIYFTYFSEFNRPWKGAAYVEAIIMIIICLVALSENIIILGFILKSKKARTVTNYFVCNLAVGDVLFVSSAPLIAYVRLTGTWHLGYGMCHVLNYWMFVCSNTMIWTMVAISIDRYICIVKGVSTLKRLSPVHIFMISASIWFIMACCFLPTVFFFHIQEINQGDTKITFCTLTWPSGRIHYSVLFTTLLLVLGFGLPVVIISINYYSIFRKFLKSKRAIAHAVSSGGRNSQTRRKREYRVVMSLVLLVTIFVMMWLPVVVVFSMIREDIENGRNEMPSYGLIWALIIAYLNPCINPILYGFMNAEFFQNIACCRRFRHHNGNVTRTLPQDEATSAAYM